MSTVKDLRRLRIKRGIRRKVKGTAEKPRLSVYKSNTGIYAQIIDDVHGTTLAAANSREFGHKKNVNVEKSKEVGKALAEKAKSHGIQNVIFDRGGYLYHGNVKALADGAREGGLKF
jgi:large subunit ribosomal protein L18